MGGKRIDYVVKLTVKTDDPLPIDREEIERAIRMLLGYGLRTHLHATGEDICVYTSVADFVNDHILEGLAGA